MGTLSGPFVLRVRTNLCSVTGKTGMGEKAVGRGARGSGLPNPARRVFRGACHVETSIYRVSTFFVSSILPLRVIARRDDEAIQRSRIPQTMFVHNRVPQQPCRPHAGLCAGLGFMAASLHSQIAVSYGGKWRSPHVNVPSRRHCEERSNPEVHNRVPQQPCRPHAGLCAGLGSMAASCWSVCLCETKHQVHPQRCNRFEFR